MKLVTTAAHLIVTLEGWERLWALRRQIAIPREAIVDIDFMAQTPAMTDLRGYLRFPGTSIPGLFMAGTYRRHGETEFWFLRMRTPGVLTIYTNIQVFAYDRVRLTCTPEIAQDIADWWRGHMPA